MVGDADGVDELGLPFASFLSQEPFENRGLALVSCESALVEEGQQVRLGLLLLETPRHIFDISHTHEVLRAYDVSQQLNDDPLASSLSSLQHWCRAHLHSGMLDQMSHPREQEVRDTLIALTPDVTNMLDNRTDVGFAGSCQGGGDGESSEEVEGSTSVPWSRGDEIDGVEIPRLWVV